MNTHAHSAHAPHDDGRPNCHTPVQCVHPGEADMGKKIDAIFLRHDVSARYT